MGFSNLPRGLESKKKVNDDVKYRAAFVYLDEIIIVRSTRRIERRSSRLDVWSPREKSLKLSFEVVICQFS